MKNTSFEKVVVVACLVRVCIKIDVILLLFCGNMQKYVV